MSVLFKISGTKPASYYKWQKRPPKDDSLEKLIIEKFLYYRKRQGVHKLKQTIQYEHGITVNHKVIRRHLRLNGYICPVRLKKQKKEADNLVYEKNILNRNFKANKPNQILATDFTYITMGGNTYYLSVVLDLFDNNPLAWYITDRNDKSLALNTMELLRKKIDISGCLIHSDKGVQYSCKTYNDYLKRYGVIQSMSRSGNCWDNAVIENFFGILKTESLYLEPARARNLDSLIDLLDEEFDYYCNHRPQNSLGGIPPNEFRKRYTESY